jgi:nucleotide-binding universal stress UspA family protein
MKRIVIGTDGSPDADRAVEQGLDLAVELGASVTFVCVRPTPNALLGQPFYQHGLEAEHAHARSVIATALEAASDLGVEASSEILDGPAAEAILDVAETHDADLIVVGSRGRGAVQSALAGSVSKALVTRSQRPLMIVKAGSGQQRERDLALVDHGAVLR